MPKFDINDYEPVEERITKFYAKVPQGSILTELVKHSEDFSKVIFMAAVFDGETPLATGWAMEEQGKGMVNGTSHLENCETSAIGRALANMGLHGNKRPSREEMEKVERAEKPEHTSEEKRIGADMKAALKELEDKGADKQVIDGYREEGAALWKEKKLGAMQELIKKIRQESDLGVF